MADVVSSPAIDVLPALQALADPNRLRIVASLRGGERCVCELQGELGMGQSLLSHHLRQLREAGLVRDRREGRWVHYTMAEDALCALESFLSEMRHAAPSAPVAGPECRVP